MSKIWELYAEPISICFTIPEHISKDDILFFSAQVVAILFQNQLKRYKNAENFIFCLSAGLEKISDFNFDSQANAF